MDELKMLIEMVAGLPAMTIWVLAGYFAYKIIIVGSIYGTIKFIADRITQIQQIRKDAEVDKITASKKTAKIDIDIKGLCITTDGTYQSVIHTLQTVRDHVHSANGKYLHSAGADWLQSAVQEKIERENLK